MHFAKPVIFVALLCSAAVHSSFAADTQQLTSKAYGEQTAEAHYSVFEYSDNDALIKTVKLLNKFGFNTDIPAGALDFSSYRGGVITASPEPGGKALTYEDALAAFEKNMKPLELPSTDALVVKITPLTVNDYGTAVKQEYKFLTQGQNIGATQPLQIPQGGLALTIVKIDNSKLLVIATTP